MKLRSPILFTVMALLILTSIGCNGLSYDLSRNHPAAAQMGVLVDAPVAKIIYRNDDNGAISGGSATYLGNRVFLTALHVLLDEDRVMRQEIRLEGCSVSITILDSGTVSEDGSLAFGQDWARFQIPDCEMLMFLELRLQYPSVSLKPVPVKAGDTVFLIGYPRLEHPGPFLRIPISVIEGRVVAQPGLFRPKITAEVFFVKPVYGPLMPLWYYKGLSGGLAVKQNSEGFHAVGIIKGVQQGVFIVRQITPDIINNRNLSK